MGPVNRGKAKFNQKKYEEALRESENRFRTFLENLPGGVFTHDLDGNYLLVNSLACRHTGYSEEELLNMNVKDIDPASVTRDDCGHIWNNLKVGESLTLESTCIRKNRSIYPVEVHLNLVVMDGRPVILSIAFDITERKNAEMALTQRSEFEQLISEISSRFVGLSSDEIDMGIDHALASVGAFYGSDRAYVLLFPNSAGQVKNTHKWCTDGIQRGSENLQNIIDAEKSTWFSKQIQKHKVFQIHYMTDLPPEALFEKEYFKAQGIKSLIVAPMWFARRLSGILILETIGHHRTWSKDEKVFLRLVGEILTNAIERKNMEKEKENLQTKLSNAIEMAHLGPWEYDVSNDIFTFNDHFYKIYRTSATEVGGYTMSSDEYSKRFIHPEDLNPTEERSRIHIDEIDPGYKPQSEHRTIFPDGTIGHISVHSYTLKDPQDGRIKIYGVNQDITARKQAEDRLRKSEEKLARSRKMESLGLLAGGVAHDLNNILSGIVSYPELLLLEMPEDNRFRKSIETIQESGNKAVAIVQDLLTMARGVASTKEPLNLNDIVREYLTSPEFKKLMQYCPNISVRTNFDNDLFNIRGSLVHIRKVIINLVSNASEAIKDEGNIIISTMNRYIDIPIRRYEDVNIGEYAVLSVMDDGSGISADSLDRIFEPFFTRKEMGRSGTGLGLAVVWNIVQDHDGYIDVKTDETGTIFELYFPITRKEVIARDLPLSVEDLRGQGETILVVDDMASQREISCSMLNALGYRTIAVSSGEEAVEYLKENRVDLILLDMIMDPGINGRETYERIAKIHPGQKAIIVSGFAETIDVKEAQRLGAGQYVKKPLTFKTIGKAIKEELGL